MGNKDNRFRFLYICMYVCVIHTHTYIHIHGREKACRTPHWLRPREGSKPSEKITLTYTIFIGEGRQET